MPFFPVCINHDARIAPAQVRRKIHNPFQFSLQEKNAIKIFYLRSILFIYLDTLLTQCYEDSPMPGINPKRFTNAPERKFLAALTAQSEHGNRSAVLPRSSRQLAAR